MQTPTDREVPSLERRTIAAVALAIAAPLPAAAVDAFGIPFNFSLPVALALSAIAWPWLARRLPREWDGALGRHPGWSMLWLVIAVLAILRGAGVAWFIADPSHPQSSAFWFDDFYIHHNCYTGYWKASEMLGAGVANLYDIAHYENASYGDFWVDAYLQVPQFLLLPRLAQVAGGDFFQVRAVWFAVEGLIMLAGLLAVCTWIGGRAGRRAALLIPALWLSSPFLVTLQLGNYQLATIALVMLAMVLFDARRNLGGGVLMALGSFKLFPGLLGIYLLITRQWRAAFWTIAISLLCVGLALAWFGTAPFDAYFHYNLPRMSSGENWAFLEYTDPVIDEGLIAVNAINDGVPGLSLKLNTFGLRGLNDFVWVNRVASVWTLLIVALTVVAARRSRSMSKIERATAWLALLTLASYRSPFVPDHEGLIAPLWLICLVTAAAPLTARNLLLLALGWVMLAAVQPFDGTPVNGYARLAVSTLSQFIAIGLCVWIVLRRPAALRESAKADAIGAAVLTAA